jgi:hypothetical protein
MADLRTITVAPGSELARLLDEAAEAPLRLEKDGVRFRLGREDADQFVDPQEFYAELTTRTDIQEILKRLAQ